MVQVMWVFCSAQVERLHQRDGAAEHEEVKYLMYTHRHIFHIRAWVEVTHDDREVEFIMLKHKVENLVDSWPGIVGSCEMMARDVLAKLHEWYGDSRHYKVSVSEDGENGAILEE